MSKDLDQGLYGDPEADPCDLWGPRPTHTMRDMVRYFEARREPTQCHLSTCWCGHFKPDWLELCFTCDPEERARWVK
jgi:hypothetical protein